MSVLSYNHANLFMSHEEIHPDMSTAFKLSSMNDALPSSKMLPQHYCENFPSICWVGDEQEDEVQHEEEMRRKKRRQQRSASAALPRRHALKSSLYRMDTFSTSSSKKTKPTPSQSDIPHVYGPASAALDMKVPPSTTNSLIEIECSSWRHYVIPDLDQLIRMESFSTKTSLAY